MPVQANVYLSPPTAQGFKPLFDTHDVFILQVEGRKNWQIYTPILAHPMRGQGYCSERDEMGEAIENFELRAGNMVYIPRGWGHHCRASTERSLHLTICILSYTWAELLIEVVSSACIRNSEFRRVLPVGFAERDHDNGADRIQFEELWRRLSAELDFEAALDHFAQRVINSCPPRLRGQIEQIQSVTTLCGDSLRGARQGALYQLTASNDKVRICAYGREVEFPAQCATALELVLATPCFHIKEIPGDLDMLPSGGLIPLAGQLGIWGKRGFVQTGQ